MPERPRIPVLDLLESYARERDVDVRISRASGRRAPDTPQFSAQPAHQRDSQPQGRHT
jgi:hypothetical protein